MMLSPHGSIDRAWTGLAIAVAMSLLPALVSAGGQTASQREQLSGVWWLVEYHADLRPDGGGNVPLSNQGRTQFEANRTALAGGSLVDSARSACVPPGIPRVLLAPYPFQILQSGEQVDFIFEANRAFRIVLLTGQHQDPDIWDPSYMGDAIAHWEGRTLIIDSSNFNAKTWLDDAGLPHSDQLHVTERLQTLDHGRRLADRITIEDPTMFTHRWSARRVYQRRSDVQLQTDWVCGEPDRSAADTRGASSVR
jgi:hypothetical protein